MSAALFKVIPLGSVISENPYCLHARQPLPIIHWVTHLSLSMCCVHLVISQFNSPDTTSNVGSSIIHTHNAYWWRGMFATAHLIHHLPPPSPAALYSLVINTHTRTQLNWPSTCKQHEAIGKLMLSHSPYIFHTIESQLSSYITSVGSSGCMQTHIRSIHIFMPCWDGLCVCVLYEHVSISWHTRLQPRVLELADGTVVYMTDELLIMPSAGCPRCLTSHALRF